MENQSPELKVAIKAALEAGKIIEHYFETELFTKEIKEDTSITTLADKEAEEIIKKIISESFPDHCILGEETGLTKNSGCDIWHIDPIDGTRNFSNGIPFFAVSIALERDNDLFVGVVYNPITRSLFYAEKGRGAYCNEKRVFVSKDDAARCMVTVASGKDPMHLKLRRNLMHDLPSGAISSVRDFGCTALDLAYVSRGSIEADIKFGLKIHDFAAGLLLVQEATGTITTPEGAPWKIGDTSFVASNGVFHKELIEEIKKQKAKLE